MNISNNRFEVIGVKDHPIFQALNVGDIIKLSKAVHRYRFDQDSKKYVSYKEMKHDGCLFAFDIKPRNNRIGADYEHHIGWIDKDVVCKNLHAHSLTQDTYDALPDDMSCVVIEKNSDIVDPSQRTIVVELIIEQRKEIA